MSEFSAEDDPDPLPELRKGLHHYKISDFLNDIVRPDSRHTIQYREWYPNSDVAQGGENGSIEQVSTTPEVKVSIRRVGLLRTLGKFVYFAVFE